MGGRMGRCGVTFVGVHGSRQLGELGPTLAEALVDAWEEGGG